MINIIFICFGNICRSPMAEIVFKKLAEERGLTSLNVISRATSDCEEGNPAYYPVRTLLQSKGYDTKHTARQITLQEAKNADYLMVMDSLNMRDMKTLTDGKMNDKIMKLGHFLPEKRDIDDPWYTRDFARTYDEIYASCNNFLDFLQTEHKEAFDYDRRHSPY